MHSFSVRDSYRSCVCDILYSQSTEHMSKDVQWQGCQFRCRFGHDGCTNSEAFRLWQSKWKLQERFLQSKNKAEIHCRKLHTRNMAQLMYNWTIRSSSAWSMASTSAPREGLLPCDRAGARGSVNLSEFLRSSFSAFSAAASLFAMLRSSL